MRFGRRPDLSQPLPTPGERLVRRTRLELAFFTLALIAILLAAIGVVTAAAAVQITDQSVDSNLHTAAENMLTALAPTPTPEPPETPLPTPSASNEPTDDAIATPEEQPSGEDGGGGEDEGHGGRTPRPTVTPKPTPTPTLTPTPSPTPTPTPTPIASPSPTAIAGGVGPDDQTPQSADTFFLILDTSGALVSNPQRVQLSGLPNSEAAANALDGHEDWRTISADGVPVRLLTEPMLGLDGSITGALQSGFVLTAHQEQQALIVRTIIVASLIGLLGAAVVTLFVTRRAMSPIRAAFDAERRFVASASHELKTPVAIVRASAEILQREKLVQPEGEYLVHDVLAESDRLGRLVGDLLALASAEAGQISISTSVFDMRALVAQVVDRVQGMAAERGVTVVAVLDSPAPAGEAELLVNADRERMLQLLMIYIDNAIDHSPQGGVVRVVARASGDERSQQVIVEVMDQGPGVPFEDRERIFEPFARVTGRRRTSGTTGLGLAIARILAARQNATLALRDAPGGGACFSVSLARRPAS
jgi:signal transduction histidine kinase